MLLRDCVLRVLFLLLDPYAMQLMLLFQVHEKFLPVFFFLVWFHLLRIYILLFYILRSLWVKEHTIVSLCLF